MVVNAVEARFFPGPAGRLDARLHGPAAGPPALVLHPHPQFGGTMGSRLVFDVTTHLAAAGMRVTRFDFRGVGRSEGTFGHGVGEVGDALAVLDALTAEHGRIPALVGYSFGGAVACRVATARDIAQLVLVGTPLRLDGTVLDPDADAPKIRAHTTLVVGDHDELVPLAHARRLAASFHPPARLDVIGDAGHFLEPSRNAAAARAVAAALDFEAV